MTAASTRAGSIEWQRRGDVMRAVLRSALAAKLTSDQHRVFLVLLDRTLSFSKDSDRTGTRELVMLIYGVDREDVQGWQRRKVSHALQALARKGLIAYATSRGSAARPLVTLLLEGVPAGTLSAEKVSQLGREGVPDEVPKVSGIAATQYEYQRESVLALAPAPVAPPPWLDSDEKPIDFVLRQQARDAAAEASA